MKYLKFFAIFIIIFLIFYIFLWFKSRKTYPLEFGISFNHQYASYLGFDWKKMYLEMLDELKPKYIRVAAMWSDVEAQKGKFDFAAVDFMLAEAEKRGVGVMLVVGQKAPRWPECHVPSEWLAREQKEKRRDYLFGYVGKTVERYRNHPALELWQVENEPFINFKFGDCRNYDESLVDDEIKLVRSLDPAHKIIVTDSGELSFWYRAAKAGDLFGTTMYRVVRSPGGRIINYDWLPAYFYRLKARLVGRDPKEVYIAELQAEPWFGAATGISTAPIATQEETMNPDRLKKHFDYARRTGFPRAYLWGVEWWYYMKEKNNDGRYWEMVKEEIITN